MTAEKHPIIVIDRCPVAGREVWRRTVEEIVGIIAPPPARGHDFVLGVNLPGHFAERRIKIVLDGDVLRSEKWIAELIGVLAPHVEIEEEPDFVLHNRSAQ